MTDQPEQPTVQTLDNDTTLTSMDFTATQYFVPKADGHPNITEYRQHIRTTNVTPNGIELIEVNSSARDIIKYAKQPPHKDNLIKEYMDHHPDFRRVIFVCSRKNPCMLLMSGKKYQLA